MKLSDIDRTYILTTDIDTGPGRVRQPLWLPKPETWINLLNTDPVRGCRDAHRAVIKNAIQNSFETILIVEDDCIWESKRMVEWYLESMSLSNFDCLWLGGMETPTTRYYAGSPSPEWRGVHCLDRTHSIILQGSTIFQRMLTGFELTDLPRTPDVYHYALSMGMTYRPTPFLTGQAAGWSHVNQRERPERW